MVKTEIFERVLADVCEVTEIPERDIMSRSRREEIVDARHLALYVRDVVDDPDQADGFIFNRWYADTVRSGIPVDWEGIL